MSEQQPQPGQMQIKADEKELQGTYSNLMMIHHSVEEFTLNFIYIFPNGAQGKLLNSMIVSPGHAKRIWRALGRIFRGMRRSLGRLRSCRKADAECGVCAVKAVEGLGLKGESRKPAFHFWVAGARILREAFCVECFAC